jgi:hypothetical protein
MDQSTRAYCQKAYSNESYRQQIIDSLTPRQKEVYEIFVCAMQLQLLKEIPSEPFLFDLNKMLERKETYEFFYKMLYT